MGITQAQQMEINQTRLEAELDKLRQQQQQAEQRAAYAEQVANELFRQRTATPHHHYTAAQGFGHPPPPSFPPPMAVPVGPTAGEVRQHISKSASAGSACTMS